MAISKAVELQRLKEKIVALDDADLETIGLYAIAVREVRKEMAGRPKPAPAPAAAKEGSTK